MRINLLLDERGKKDNNAYVALRENFHQPADEDHDRII